MTDTDGAMRGPRASVLVVDDEGTIRLAIGRFLERRGYTITAVPDAGAALGALEASPAGHYALMLCDVRMPGMSGVDLVPRARAVDPALAVVMLSAVDDAASARAAFLAGAVDYLVKPLELTASGAGPGAPRGGGRATGRACRAAGGGNRRAARGRAIAARDQPHGGRGARHRARSQGSVRRRAGSAGGYPCRVDRSRARVRRGSGRVGPACRPATRRRHDRDS